MVVNVVIECVKRLSALRPMTTKGLLMVIGILVNIFALYILRRIFFGGLWGLQSRRIRGNGKHGSARRSSGRKHKKDGKDGVIKSSAPKLLLLLGIPGSGKTTWLNQYLETCDSSYVIVNEESVRARLSMEDNNPPKEEAVREAMINDIVKCLNDKQNVVVDNSVYVLDETFRRRIMEVVPSCNRLVKEFPIKALFASLRLSKETEEGGRRVCPTEIELEELETAYERAKICVTEEGWKPLLMASYKRSRA